MYVGLLERGNPFAVFMGNDKMKSLLIIGAGGYGQLVREIAIANEYEKIDFLDDANSIAVGKVNDLDEYQANYDGCVIAIGNPTIRSQIAKRVTKIITLIHPDAIVSPSAKISEGCIVEAGVIINTNVCISKYKKQFLIPKGFAHGFLVLTDTAEFCYKCDDFYHANDEGGLAWNDPEIGITWPQLVGEYQGSASAIGYTLEDGTALNLSDKDQKWVGLKDTFKF